jgi:hypothetical protein
MVNSHRLILHNTEHKKGKRKHDYDGVYTHDHPTTTTPLQLENVFDLGYM